MKCSQWQYIRVCVYMWGSWVLSSTELCTSLHCCIACKVCCAAIRAKLCKCLSKIKHCSYPMPDSIKAWQHKQLAIASWNTKDEEIEKFEFMNWLWGQDINYSVSATPYCCTPTQTISLKSAVCASVRNINKLIRILSSYQLSKLVQIWPSQEFFTSSF